MNKNDKFLGAEFDVSAQAISDEELDAVAGGNSHHKYETCTSCGERVRTLDIFHTKGLCLDDPQHDPQYS